MKVSAVRDAAIALGVLLSAGIWLSYVAFYDELGLSPSDVGIGFGQVLERSIGALVFIAVLSVSLAVMVTYLVAFGFALRGLKPSDPESRYWPIRLLPRESVKERPDDRLWQFGRNATRVTVSVVLALALLPAAVLWLNDGEYVLALGAVALAGFYGWGLLREDAGGWDVAVVDLRVLRRYVGGIAAVVSVLAITVFVVDANTFADRVKHGEAVGGDGPFGLPTTAISGRPSRLEPGGTACVLYLGSSEGATFVYDPRADRTQRVPSGDVKVSIDPDADRC